MANTWNGMYADNIAIAGFNAFKARLISLGLFSTDFSSDVKKQGEVVNTRIVPVSQAAVDLQTGVAGTAGDREDANIIEDIATTEIAVTLNQQPITGFALTDEEVMIIGSGVANDTNEKILENKAYAVADAVLDYTFNLITNANFSTAIHVGAASAFDLDDVVDIGTSLEEDHAWNLATGQSLVVKPAYRGALKKDGAIQDGSASGLDVVRTGKLEHVDQFDLVAAPTLPPAGGTPASENLTGFVAKPAAIAIAMRAVMSQSPSDLVDIRVMSDEATGVTLVFRSWYNAPFGKRYCTFETLFGASKGQAEALKRITSS